MMTPEEAYERLIKFGNEWSDKNAAADLLEETRRTLRAQLAMKFLPVAKAMNKAEIMAEGSDGYEEHIKLMVEARKESNKAMVRYKAVQACLDMERTLEASRRMEIKHLGG